MKTHIHVVFDLHHGSSIKDATVELTRRLQEATQLLCSPGNKTSLIKFSVMNGKCQSIENSKICMPPVKRSAIE